MEKAGIPGAKEIVSGVMRLKMARIEAGAIWCAASEKWFEKFM